MVKRFGLLFLVAILAVGLAGCRQSTAPSEQNQPVNPAAAASGSLPTAADNLLPEDEAGLLAALAGYNNATLPSQYQLHDVLVKDNWARGRFSVNNELRPDMFWAVKTDGTWQIALIDQDPDCAKLAGFSVELKAGCRANFTAGQISNFDDCLKAGFKSTDDRPRRCTDGAGSVFLEAGVAGLSKRYISQEVSKCADLDFDCASDEQSFLDDKGCGCQK